MEKSNIIVGVTSFLVGAGIGIASFALISFTDTKGISKPPPPIDKTEGAKLTQNYFDQATTFEGKFKAFTLDTAQVVIMRYMMETDKTIPGFRIYLANPSPTNADKIGIVVAIDRAENDVLTNIYSTAGVHIGPCPNVCDRNSSPLNH